jgi:hypothetical protein
VLAFRTAYASAENGDILMTNPRDIAWNYASGFLFVDVASTVPVCATADFYSGHSYTDNADRNHRPYVHVSFRLRANPL